MKGMVIMEAVHSVIDYILPYRCSNCSNLISRDHKQGVCYDCFPTLDFITAPYCNKCGIGFAFEMKGMVTCANCASSPPNYEFARSLFKFNEKSKSIIHDFKYADRTSHAEMFSELFLSRYHKDVMHIDAIVPVPMNRFKRVFRHYNPAQVLAAALAKSMGREAIPNALIKSKWTNSQTNLNKKERRKNLSDSLKYNPNVDLEGKNILLVDDVRTTGATSAKCTSLLKKAGAKKVVLFTIALV